MKTKFKIITQILQIPNRDEWMIQRQYCDGGAIFTDDNDGNGYTEDQAHAKAFGNPESLFSAIVAAGIKYASHETDLYLPDTEQTRAILACFPTSQTNATRFQNQVEGGTWIDVPFAYLPAWEAKQRKS